ncbi:hypothetical protein [Lactobacillus terrae]|uniref:hypothetical protein n=1 Tax=Lactobacillus terrae TaxID=2269374 RepID=UPI000C1B640E|nr:hypothetical protein [Lactobacillus terrae]
MKPETKVSRWLLHVAQGIVILTAVVFVIMLSRGVANASVTQLLNSQYQQKEFKILKTKVNERSLDFVGGVIKSTGDSILSQDNIKSYREVKKIVDERKENDAKISSLYDDKSNYHNGVDAALINDIDKNLTGEKNQDIYQKQKNRLDKIQIWYEQTQDADKNISKAYDDYTDDNSSLSFENITLVNTYYQLIKNKTVKDSWSDIVNELNTYYDGHEQVNSRVTDAQRELDRLKNSSLGDDKFQPAVVTIISTADMINRANKVLSANNITDSKVLYYDSVANKLAVLTYKSGKYSSNSGTIGVKSSQVSGGQYGIKKLISDESTGIVTDSSGSFGQVISIPSDSYPSNSTSNFNAAKPVFWVKNDSDLTNSIYFSSSSSIGFIYSGSSKNNGLVVSSSDLGKLKSQVSTGMIFYAN